MKPRNVDKNCYVQVTFSANIVQTNGYGVTFYVIVFNASW
jgi:hypothetical protein